MSLEPKFQCEYQEDIVCPYCGYKDEETFEYCFDSECQDMECKDCGKTFSVTEHKKVSYTSQCLEHDYVDDPSDEIPDKQTCTRCGDLHFKRFDTKK